MEDKEYAGHILFIHFTQGIIFMKQKFVAILSGILLTGSILSGAYAAETYNIDPHHANINWNANHFGFSNPSGHFNVSKGTLVLDEAKPENSKVDVTIDVDGLTTGIADFDKHLKSADFLDTAKYPTATFKSTKVDVTGKDTAKVTGNLTLHGITKPVILDMKLNKIAPSPMTTKKTAGFSGKITLLRSQFGIDKYVPNISDEVQIQIEAEANLVEPAAKK